MLSKLKELIFWKLRGEVPVWAYVERGLKVGKNFSMQPGCSLDYAHCWLIEIGNDVTIAPRVQVLAHDASTKRALGYAKIGKVKIGDSVFIGAGSIILPNIIIGKNVIIGAGSVVSRNIPEGSIAAGNPAKVIGYTSEYIDKNKKMMSERPIFEEDYTIRGNINEEKKVNMLKKISDDIGFVK